MRTRRSPGRARAPVPCARPWREPPSSSAAKCSMLVRPLATSSIVPTSTRLCGAGTCRPRSRTRAARPRRSIRRARRRSETSCLRLLGVNAVKSCLPGSRAAHSRSAARSSSAGYQYAVRRWKTLRVRARAGGSNTCGSARRGARRSPPRPVRRAVQRRRRRSGCSGAAVDGLVRELATAPTRARRDPYGPRRSASAACRRCPYRRAPSAARLELLLHRAQFWLSHPACKARAVVLERQLRDHRAAATPRTGRVRRAR